MILLRLHGTIVDFYSFDRLLPFPLTVRLDSFEISPKIILENNGTSDSTREISVKRVDLRSIRVDRPAWTNQLSSCTLIENYLLKKRFRGISWEAETKWRHEFATFHTKPKNVTTGNQVYIGVDLYEPYVLNWIINVAAGK